MQPLTWKALEALRNGQSNSVLARRALEATTTGKITERRVQSLGNYFSRIINGHIPHPSLDKLQLIALGMNYPSLAAFFDAWETASASGVTWAPGMDEAFTESGDFTSPSPAGSVTKKAARKRVPNGHTPDPAEARAIRDADIVAATRAIAALNREIRKFDRYQKKAHDRRGPGAKRR